jgi:hypothetical protein
LPDEVTSIDCVVAPLDQRYDSAALAVSVTEPPAQNVVGPEGAIAATGRSLTVTTRGAEVVLQPLAFVTVTVYVPEVVGVIDCVVAPLDQRYDALVFAVMITEPPAQNVSGPDTEVCALGTGFTVTCVADDVALQPFAETVTV